MNRLQKTLHVASWLPLLALMAVLALLGLVLVPIGLQFNKWPRVLWLWGNDEYPRSPLPGISDFVWLAIRNPVNNHRFIFKDYTSIGIETNWSIVQPMEAKWLLRAGFTSAWRWKWRGPFAGYRRVWIDSPTKYSEFWIGWKVGSEVPGLGFTLQLRLKRPIGQ